MTITVRWTGYGIDAARALHAAVAEAKAGEPLAPVVVVVPSNHVGVATRRWLASGSLGPVAGSGVGLAAVTFVTPYRLAELLGAPALAAQGKRPVSTPVLAAAMRAELTADAGLFAPVREHPATESALVATYRELRDLSPAALDALARTSDRAGEVVRLHRAVRARLAAAWSDEEDLLLAASSVDPAHARRELGALVLYLPQRLTQHGAALLRSLAEHTPMSVIAGTTGDPEADGEVHVSLARLGIAAPPDVPPPPIPVTAERTTIVTTSDADEEVRAAVRSVIDAVRGGTPLDRIALLHASPDPYGRLAHEQLAAAGIETNGVAVAPLAARVAGRTLLDLLALRDGGYRRQDVLAWLAAAPMLAHGRWAPTTAWERISREAAIVRGRDEWDHRLLREADRAEAEAAALEADGESEGRVEGRRREAERARDLRTFVLRTIDDLERAASAPRRWSDQAAWAQDRLSDLLGGGSRRDGWPADEQRAAERVEVALERLGALDAVEGPVALDVFARTLEVELDNDLGRLGRFGKGVLVAPVEMGIGLDLDLVVILGLAEGAFPAVVRDDSLLPDHERATTAGELGLRSDRVQRQHRHLLATLAGAASQVLSVPRGDLRRSAERVPSRWVLDIATQLAADERRWWTDDLLHATVPWVHHVASFDAGLRSVPDPATDQEHRLRTLLASGGDLTASNDDVTCAAAEVVHARRSTAFTRFDGNLAGFPIHSPIDRITSPTRLERWALCPHRHFVEDILRAEAIDNPEDILMITPIEKGNLVHEALERFLEVIVALPPSERPKPTQRWTDADRARLREIGAVLCDAAEAKGITGRPIFWKRDRRRILADLDRFLTADDTWRSTTSTRPLAVELGFGFGDGLDAVALDLPDGRILHLRGRADRVDLASDGTLHVIDYKTGKADPYRGLGEDDPVMAGTKLQLPIYGLAGRALHGTPGAPVVAEYWFVTSRGRFDRTGYRITEDVLAKARAVIGTIVAGIEAGVFPPFPTANASTRFFIDCEVCDPDGLGIVDLRQQWERKRDDPALAVFADLAEPYEADDASVPA